MARILILEPSTEVRELLVRFVDRLGHEPVAALEPEEPLPAPDAAILEPAWKAGLAAAQVLRSQNPDLPILCLSTDYPTPASKALSPARHLLKPVSLAEFESAVQTNLGIASAGS